LPKIITVCVLVVRSSRRSVFVAKREVEDGFYFHWHFLNILFVVVFDLIFDFCSW